MPNLESILDRYEPRTPPSERYDRLVDVGTTRLLELRDPNSGQGGVAADKPRHQYAVADGQLWTRTLPPETVGDVWVDTGAPRWEIVQQLTDLLTAYLREAESLRCLTVRREPTYVGDEVEYVVRGECVSADEVDDVALVAGPITGSMWDVPLPPCPDCGGDLVWYEAGHVPGTRRCMGERVAGSAAEPSYNQAGGCGSMYTIV